MLSETPLQTGERHVREAEERVARQRQVVKELARDGHPTSVAVDILVQCHADLRHYREEVAILRRSSRSLSGRYPRGGATFS
jgi:hypothetical protein